MLPHSGLFTFRTLNWRRVACGIIIATLGSRIGNTNTTQGDTMRGQLATLRQQGFDASYPVPFTRTYQVRCSCCEALVLNGLASHETGCPHQVYECKGCNTTLSYRGYCEDCR